jgi:hypothetical protein
VLTGLDSGVHGALLLFVECVACEKSSRPDVTGPVPEATIGLACPKCNPRVSRYRSLDEGARVSFVVKKGPKGLQAEDVSLA